MRQQLVLGKEASVPKIDCWQRTVLDGKHTRWIFGVTCTSTRSRVHCAWPPQTTDDEICFADNGMAKCMIYGMGT